MAEPRFFCPQELKSGAEFFLEADAAHHAARVLRLVPGDAVVLFDGKGGEYPATVSQVRKGAVRVTTGARRGIERESPLAIILAQAVSAGEKMDFTLQKAVELGVSAIQPLESSRSVVHLDGARAQKRLAHWRKVVLAACEQCGRNRIPEVEPLKPFDQWLAEAGAPRGRYLLSPGARIGLGALESPGSPLVLLAGPEGGFSPEEEAAAQAAGFIPVRLGPRILRTETAALAALAAMQALWGDL